MTKTITSVNNVFMLSIASLYPTAQQIQGFATDDAFSFADAVTGETRMGVDNILSVGYLPVAHVQTIMLQANSPSIQLFDDWFMAERQLGDKLEASGTIYLPAIGKTYNLVRGFVTSQSVIPPVKKQLEARKFEITWNKLEPQNT